MVHQVTKLGTSLYEPEEEELVTLLMRNIDLFVLAPSYMPDINTRVVCHHLTIDLVVKPVSQRSHKVVKEKRETINEEVHKLINVTFITKVKYSSLVAKMVLVNKASNKWHMCIDLIDLNDACPRICTLYPI